MPGTAEIITELRKAKGMTQEELATRLFVSRALVSLWELGTRLPDYSNVVRMAKLFDVRESDIIGEEDYLYASSGEMNAFYEEIEEITRQAGRDYNEAEFADIINALLTGLSRKERAVFIGRYHEAKTNKAIAKEFNMSETAVRVMLTRIRKK